MAVMVRVTEGTSPGGCSSVIGSVLMVAEGNSVDRYHFSLSTSSVGKGQATRQHIGAPGISESHVTTGHCWTKDYGEENKGRSVCPE